MPRRVPGPRLQLSKCWWVWKEVSVILRSSWLPLPWGTSSTLKKPTRSPKGHPCSGKPWTPEGGGHGGCAKLSCSDLWGFASWKTLQCKVAQGQCLCSVIAL